MNGQTSRGGWFEGTALNVISRGTVPKRSSSVPRLNRLPSQDSLDRSIHNDSGHGKSAVEIVRDLKQANARLTARTAELEADFMNQLQEATRKFETQQHRTDERLAQKEKHIVSLETRCKSMESRFRDKEEQVTKLKEESAFQRHTISDLKTQMNEMELDAASSFTKRDLDSPTDVSRNVSNDPDSPGSSWRQLERTQDALQRTEQALADLQNEQKRIQASHSKRVASLKEELAASNATCKRKEQMLQARIDGTEEEGPSLESQIADTDITILQLREQVLNYSGQLTDLTAELTKLKASKESQELYRRDEADDLRVLNDAQEEQIEALRKELEVAVQEIELREQELVQYTRARPRVDEKNDLVVSLREALHKAQESNRELQLELEKTRGETAMCVANLQVKIEDLEATKETILAGCKASDGGNPEAEQLKMALAAIEENHRAKIEKIQNESRMKKSELMSQLDARESELSRLRRGGTSSGESSEDVARVAALEAEVERLRAAANGRTRQSGGSVEEDLRKDLQSLKVIKDSLHTELATSKRDRDKEIAELKGKLEDRDTTISALVKSSVTFEEQLVDAQAEITMLRTVAEGHFDDAGVDVILSRGDSAMKEEVIALRESVERHRKNEARLSNDISRLRKEQYTSKQVITRLRTQIRAAARSAGKVDTKLTDEMVLTEEEIKERDDAIANLLKQSISQEKLVSELQQKLVNVSFELETSMLSEKESPSSEELQQLRQEAEVFAGQVIELDEEIESLKAAVETRDEQIANLEQEVQKLRARPPPPPPPPRPPTPPRHDLSAKISSLEAEIDELQEANTTQRDEIRLLRRKAREVESFPDEIAAVQKELYESQKEVEVLKQAAASIQKDDSRTNELEARLRSALKAQEEADGTVSELRAEVSCQREKIRELENSQGAARAVSSPVTLVDEFEMEKLRDEVRDLQKKLKDHTAAAELATETVRELESLLAEKNSTDAAAYEDEKEELLAENDNLSKQLAESNAKLAEVEQERGIIEDFKLKLEAADESRETSEKSIVDNYERKLTLLTLDKDITIDKLRKELVEEKEANSEELEEAAAQVDDYEMQIKELKEEKDELLHQHETKVFALEHTLEAQEQLVNNMRIEMDHLQSSMDASAAGRRGEVEDMQKELVEITAANVKQEREIKDLRMQLEAGDLEHKEQVARLKDTIASLEDKTATDRRDASDLKMELRVQEVKERLDKLKWLNTSLKEENEALRERLIKTGDRALVGERARAEVTQLKKTIQGQVEKITELELELETVKQTPIVIHGPPIVSPSRSSKSPRRLRGLLGRKRASSLERSSQLPPKPI